MQLGLEVAQSALYALAGVQFAENGLIELRGELSRGDEAAHLRQNGQIAHR